MMSFEPDVTLLEYILSGEAVLWIGAGASAEMGYPSWEKQAQDVRVQFEKQGLPYDKEGFEKYIAAKDFPSAFSALCGKVGKKKLLALMKKVTVPSADGRDTIYNEVTKWPIGTYITTNFDDEIASHLQCNQPSKRYVVVGNSDSDIELLGGDGDRLVFKVHGNLSDEHGSVVTAEDYHSFTVAKKKFQQALIRLFKTKKVIIIGYGLGDKDVQLALEAANTYGKAKTPVYLLLADVTETDAEIKKNIYNVKIVPYSNKDLRHAQLGKILSSYGMFLNNKKIGKPVTVDAQEAVPLFMFRSLNKTARTIDAHNYVLMKAPSSKEKAVEISELSKLVAIDGIDIVGAVSSLKSDRLLFVDANGCINRTLQGDDEVAKVRSRSQGIEEVAYQNFIQSFGILLDSSQEKLLKKCARLCIERIFDKHGLEMMRSIYQDSEFDGYSMRDVYEIIADESQVIDDVDLKLAFIHAIRSFIISPTKNQKQYMASLSQGYVMYHLLGKGASCKGELDRMARQDVWYIDSNVIQPLLAKNCPGHELAMCMIGLIKKLKLNVKTTPNVLKEVYAHYEWARHNVPNIDEIKNILRIPENDGQYNFFLSGYAESVFSKSVDSFDEYSEDVGATALGWVESTIKAFGIELVTVGESENLDKLLLKETASITSLRKSKGILSDNPLQVPTDVELYLCMCDEKRRMEDLKSEGNVRFLSSSGLFNLTEHHFKNWSMAKFVRYISFMSERWTSVDTLADCLRSELCSSGMVIVNEKNLDDYFGKAINTADLNLKREKRRLGKLFYELAEMSEDEINERIQSEPTYDKAEFMDQLIDRVKEHALDAERKKNDKLDQENQMLRKRVSELEALYAKSVSKSNKSEGRSSRDNKKMMAGKKRAAKQAVRKSTRRR